MRNIFIITGLILSSWQTSAQDANQLSQLQSANPNKIVMSLENYNALDSAQQAKIQGVLILLEDVDATAMNSFVHDVSEDSAEHFETENFIKRWLAANNTVKIVKQSQYQGANEMQKAMYDQPEVLVLEGEEITRRDIENY